MMNDEFIYYLRLNYKFHALQYIYTNIEKEIKKKVKTLL